MVSTFERLGTFRMKVGEAPIWSSTESALYWIDCEAPALFRMDEATTSYESWQMPSRIGGLVMGQRGPVVALRTGIFEFDRNDGALNKIAAPPIESDHLFLHEARCDPCGRLWVGMINANAMVTGERGGARLYYLDSGTLKCAEAAGEFTVANGLAWNVAGDRMYFSDLVSRTIWIFDYDLGRGIASNRRVFFKTDPNDGMPDGATVDSEDGYWFANCRGSRLVRLLPDGSVDRELAAPSRTPTQPAFGGPNMKRLFLTTHSLGADPELGDASPDGGLYAINMDIPGRPEPLLAQ